MRSQARACASEAGQQSPQQRDGCCCRACCYSPVPRGIPLGSPHAAPDQGRPSQEAAEGQAAPEASPQATRERSLVMAAFRRGLAREVAANAAQEQAEAEAQQAEAGGAAAGTQAAAEAGSDSEESELTFSLAPEALPDIPEQVSMSAKLLFCSACSEGSGSCTAGLEVWCLIHLSTACEFWVTCDVYRTGRACRARPCTGAIGGGN